MASPPAEAAPGGPPVDSGELGRMAGNALAAVGLGRGQASELAALAASIAGTDFWARAMAAGRRLFEVPFSVRVEAGDPDHAALLEGGPLVARAGGKPVDVVPGAPWETVPEASALAVSHDLTFEVKALGAA